MNPLPHVAWEPHRGRVGDENRSRKSLVTGPSVEKHTQLLNCAERLIG